MGEGVERDKNIASELKQIQFTTEEFKTNITSQESLQVVTGIACATQILKNIK